MSVNNMNKTSYAEKGKTGFKEGNPGRPKGVKNKLTTNIKDMLFSTLNDKRIGGLEGFIEWVTDTKGNKILFYTWLMKMLPTSLVGEMDDKGGFEPLRIEYILAKAKKQKKGGDGKGEK